MNNEVYASAYFEVTRVTLATFRYWEHRLLQGWKVPSYCLVLIGQLSPQISKSFGYGLAMLDWYLVHSKAQLERNVHECLKIS